VSGDCYFTAFGKKSVQLGLLRADRPVQIDVPNVKPGLAPVEGWVGVPTIHLLSVGLVDLTLPNPAVRGKRRDISRDFALRKDKELMEMLSPPMVSYAKKVRIGDDDDDDDDDDDVDGDYDGDDDDDDDDNVDDNDDDDVLVTIYNPLENN
uniref:Uncharacterized protein n=1 Tax=Glossina morsitans morsitans TaxID=37546 RepID=A0A1B0FKR4_GLOMM